MDLETAERYRADPAIRGVSFLLGSLLVMVGSAYATYAIVGRALTTPEFGVFGVILAITNALNAVLGTGMHQAMSLLVSRHAPAQAALLRWGLRRAVVIGAGAALCFVAGAPLLAFALHDPSLTWPLMIVALCPGFYAMNAVSLGFLNGVRAFERQGLANAIQAVSRMALICAAASAGFGIEGTSVALVAAGALGTLASRKLAKISPATESMEFQPTGIGRSLLGFVGVALLLQLLLTNDLLLLKRLLPSASANTEVGLYTAAQSIARVPFFLLIAVSQNAYPRLAQHRESARRASTLVVTGLVAAWIGLLALALPLHDRFIEFIYPSRYAAGTKALAWLFGGSAALTLVEASVTMLSGVTGPRRSIWILAGTVITQTGLALVWIPRHGAVGAAEATVAASIIGFVVASLWLRSEVGTSLSARLLASALPLASALGVLSWSFARLGSGPLGTLSFMVAAYAAYLLGVYKLGVR